MQTMMNKMDAQSQKVAEIASDVAAQKTEIDKLKGTPQATTAPQGTPKDKKEENALSHGKQWVEV